MGFGVVLFLARLMSVEEELFDAAKIDGATWWQLQRHITVPQLASVIEFFTVVSVITMLLGGYSVRVRHDRRRPRLIDHGDGSGCTST